MKDKNKKKDYELFIDQYKEYILSYEESWYNNLEKVKLYINENKCRPVDKSKDNNIKQLGQWLLHQQSNYKNNDNLMKNENIKRYYELFLEEYKEYFLSNEEIWYEKLEQVKLYINENKCRPANNSKNNNIKQLVNWIGHQQNNYNKNERIMKDNNIRIKWEQFINEYKEYFK